MKKQGRSVRWIVTGAPDSHNADSVKYYRLLRSLRRQLRLTREVVFLCERFADGVKDEEKKDE